MPDFQLVNIYFSTLYCIIHSNKHIFASDIIILNQVKSIIMKKILITLCFISITVASFAGNTKSKNISPEKMLDASIQTQLVYPDFLLQKTGEHTAEVHFTINPNGTIIVKEINTEEPDLRENLTYQLRNFRVSTSGLDLSDTYKIVLRFNTL